MQPAVKDDSRLIEACFQGKPEAFKPIVRKYQNYICALTYSATGDRDTSEELAQEVFVIAWNNLSKLRDHCKFKSWLYRITQNRIKQYYRTSKRDVISQAGMIEHCSVASEQPDPQSEAIAQEDRQFVRRVLNQIPANYRDPLILFYWEGQSVREVARELDLSEDTAKKRLSRGRAMVKNSLLSAFERTVSQSRPTNKFATSVIGLIAAGTLTMAGSASAATAEAAVDGGGVLANLMSGLSTKIAAAAAIVAVTVGTGAYVAHRNHTQSAMPLPVQRETVKTLPKSLKSGLVLYLSFDSVQEDQAGDTVLYDQSWNKNHGMLLGGEFTEGVIGNALKLDAEAKDNGVIVKDSDLLDVDAVTIAAWIKTDRADYQWGRILDKGWRTGYNLCIGGDYGKKTVNRDKLSFECASQCNLSKTPITDGRWHFIVGAYDGLTSALYIDGKLESQLILKKAMPMKHTETDIHIACLATTEAPPHHEAFYGGLIDEIRVYNRILSAEEIQSLYCYQPEF